MARKKASGYGGVGANWMDTYGDLVTLLLTFFVLLFSFSSVDAQKWEALVGALSGSAAITIPVLNPEMAMERPIPLIATSSSGVTPDSTDLEDYQFPTDPVTGLPTDYPGGLVGDGEQAVIDYQNFLLLYKNLSGYIEENQIAADVEVDYESYVVVIRFKENILFTSGSAELVQESRPTLNHLINAIAANLDFISMVRVEGHTDNVPIKTTLYKDNWDLSVMRATAAIRYMEESLRIPGTKLSGSGYAANHPVAPNDTEEGRAENRRVDFVVEGFRTARNNTQGN